MLIPYLFFLDISFNRKKDRRKLECQEDSDKGGKFI